MGLFGNGSGRPKGSGHQNQYLKRYGMDIELAERKNAAAAKEKWSQWLTNALRILESAYETTMENARELLPEWDRAAELTVQRAFFHWISYGAVSGNVWGTEWSTKTGIYVGKSTLRPYRRLAELLLERHGGVCGYEAFVQSVGSGRTVFAEEGALTGSRCGSLWRELIRTLPAYFDGVLPPISGGFYTVCDDAEDERKVRCLRELMKALFPLYTFFSGRVDDEADEANEQHQKRLEAHWEQLGKKNESDDDEEA